MAGDGTWLCVGSEGARQQKGDKVAMASLPSSSKSSSARSGSSSSVTPTRLPDKELSDAHKVGKEQTIPKNIFMN
uniref:Uncharacterized protein n=1 Tax=Oryza meridionalis TaxID=40149 RepID=A0A0E0EBK5_9ORYZ